MIKFFGCGLNFVCVMVNLKIFNEEYRNWDGMGIIRIKGRNN